VKEDDPVWAEVSIGSYRTKEKQLFRWSKSGECFSFKAVQVIDEKLTKDMQLPVDID
jgi:hypothetical protein